MLTPLVATALCLFPMTIIAAVAGPSQQDLYALLGVAPATVIVIYNALKKERSFELAVSVFCGAGAIGAFGPGIMLYYILKVPFDTVIWQAWMGLGFICAIFGWFLAHSALKLAASFSPWIARRFFFHYMPGAAGEAERRKDNNENNRTSTHRRN